MSHLERLLWGCFAILSLTVSYGLGAEKIGSQDRQFMEDAAKGGMTEVQMGRLGLERATSPQIKAFCQRLVNDHTTANDELNALAKKKGVTLAPGASKSETSMFAGKTGSNFDLAFTKAMVDNHEKDIAEFEKEANSGSDPDVKGWASRTLPTLREHLEAAKTLNK